jgi:hypothetical protein
MSLLLAPDDVALYAGTASDAHGWAGVELGAPLWNGQGNLQRQPGRTDPLAAGGGGLGPADPNVITSAALFLPMDAPVADGVLAVIGGQRFALGQVRKVTDPTGSGWLDCWAATATGVDWAGETYAGG